MNRLRKEKPTLSLLNLLESIIGRSSLGRPLPYNGSIVELATEADDVLKKRKPVERTEEQYRKLFGASESQCAESSSS